MGLAGEEQLEGRGQGHEQVNDLHHYRADVWKCIGTKARGRGPEHGVFLPTFRLDTGHAAVAN